MQFTLSFMLLAFAVVALSLAVFGPMGILVGGMLVGIGVSVHVAQSRTRQLEYLTIGLIIGLLCVLMWLAVIDTRVQSSRAACMTNLTQLAMVLYQYRLEHGTLPPVRQRDSDGKPFSGWRVLILPLMSDGQLFQQYNRDEPWNGPNNLRLVSPMPGVYRCPCDRADKTLGRTSYVAVVGSDGSWLGPPAKADGPNPVWLVETCDLGVVWTEPRDVSLEDICRATSISSSQGLSSKHVFEGGFFYYDRPAGAHAVFADGHVRRVPPGVPADVLRAALLGDRKKQEELDAYDRAAWRVNWPNCAALAGLVVCFLLMLVWPRAGRQRADEAEFPEPQPESNGEKS